MEALIVKVPGGDLLTHWQKLWRRQSSESSSRWHSQQAVLQRALECSYQRQLIEKLHNGSLPEPESYDVQAVFCIDVRSEVMRRALEAGSLRFQTLGFAGFFGLPVQFTPLGSKSSRPHLPGLLPASLNVVEQSDDPEETRRALTARVQELRRDGAREPFFRLPGSGFTLVESLGLGYMLKILQRLIPSAKRRPSSCCILQPEFSGEVDDTSLVDIAERALRNMSLVGNFAPVVLLVGHGSHTTNNPQQAALDCGACCGQTGEVNARLLARTLNKATVRKGLQERGIDIPEQTLFVPALHTTTTDCVTLFDVDHLSDAEQNRLNPIREALATAGETVRKERAGRLGLDAQKDHSLEPDYVRRANDWSETRPEWGLANNAAFIIAPRRRTAGINLDGRVFLHEYDAKLDHDNSILELIMTAPMLVTHWINMQYYASTVDNLHFGSGNKILHNVVGGRLGVFEGNGGDLRVGLSFQSLNDGENWIHTPLRLSVFIEAPINAIRQVVGKHRIVSDLVRNHWIYLFRIDEEGRSCRVLAG